MVFAGYAMATEFAGNPRGLKPQDAVYKLLPEVMRGLGTLGYSGAEHAPFTDGRALGNKIATEWLSAVHVASREHNIKVTGLHWILSFLSLVKPKKEGLSIFAEGRKQDETLRYYGRLIDYCSALGGTYLVHGSPPSRQRAKGERTTTAMRKAAEFFTEYHIPGKGKVNLVDYAAIRRVRIGFEPLSTHETNFVNTVEQGLELDAMVGHPAFGVTIDVKAMAAEGRPVEDTIRTVPREKVVAVHFNDPSLVGPCLGDTDFVPIMRALVDIGYKDMITVEPFELHGETSFDDCEEILKRLRKCEAEVERQLAGK